MCILSSCHLKGNKSYGDYCKKHRNNYLVNNGIIVFERFTSKESDYLKKDIINTIEHFNIMDKKDLKSKKKKEVFFLLALLFKNLNFYDENDIKQIVKIQRLIKKKNKKKIDFLRGNGFTDHKLCNNDTDFFSFETVDELDEKYFFSYQDGNEFTWFFDIRSFNKLIEMKQPNPYTLNTIPSDAIEKASKLTQLLKLNESDELVNYKELKRTKKQIIKQKTIDLFSDIDQSGYYCQPEWFLNLSIIKLKKLYRNLEDIWNFRLQLSNQEKSRICPPNGLVFTIRVSDVFNYTNKEDIQDLILNEVTKFQNALNSEDRKLGYMYFIIGLGSHGISHECFNCHSWLMYV